MQFFHFNFLYYIKLLELLLDSREELSKNSQKLRFLLHSIKTSAKRPRIPPQLTTRWVASPVRVTGGAVAVDAGVGLRIGEVEVWELKTEKDKTCALCQGHDLIELKEKLYTLEGLGDVGAKLLPVA